MSYSTNVTLSWGKILSPSETIETKLEIYYKSWEQNTQSKRNDSGRELKLTTMPTKHVRVPLTTGSLFTKFI